MTATMNAQQKQIIMAAAAGIAGLGALYFLVRSSSTPASVPAAEQPAPEKAAAPAKTDAPKAPTAEPKKELSRESSASSLSRKSSSTSIIPVGGFVKSKNLKDGHLNGLVGTIVVAVEEGNRSTGKATVKFQDGKKRLIKQANIVRIDAAEYEKALAEQRKRAEEDVKEAETRARKQL
ncbi:hypothetical protein DIPPA_02766 [Diplonema papillatum]|nr:hypothetical protein DIPPA_02766 [Diplonema papillatum]